VPELAKPLTEAMRIKRLHSLVREPHVSR
jgi:hypothetical protein